MASYHAAFRESARRTLGSLADISDDEESPNYERIHGPTSLGQAQRALAFINALRSGSASSTGFSTNVDMVANDLGRKATFPPHSPSQSSSSAGETHSEAMERYLALDEVMSQIQACGTIYLTTSILETKFQMKAKATRHSET